MDAQNLGLKSGRALKIFNVPEGYAISLEHLIESGKAEISGIDPFSPERSFSIGTKIPELLTESKTSPPLICDTLIPCFDPQTLWLGVYQVKGRGVEAANNFAHPALGLCIEQITCVDKLSLMDVDNDTCWFYPTEDGEYLSWESQHSIVMEPGFLPGDCLFPDQHHYERSNLNLLWSLMAKDENLTCVGLTYMRRRIEWSCQILDKTRSATWTSFEVDSLAKNSYSELSKITVFSNKQL